MTVFYHVMLPVLLIFLSGFLVQKWQHLNLRALSTLAIYILSPCLVFRTFYQTSIDLQYAYMVLFAVVLLMGLIVLNKLFTFWRKLSPNVESGLILSSAFMNSGNYGVPVILFAYGEAGFHYAVSYMVLQSILMNFVGIYYAARGQAGVGVAIRLVFKMPTTYAAAIAILFQTVNIRLPDQFYGAIDLVADAAIPVVMLILGMQLADLKLKKLDWETIGFGVLARMFVSPLIAVLLLSWMPIDPLLKKVLIVSSAMPSAATTVMYAVQFDAEPELVSSITLVTTLVSVVTLSVLLMVLG